VIVGVDHSGPEPVVVLDLGNGEERWTMDMVLAAAADAPADVRDRVEQSTRGEEYAHTLYMGYELGDDEPPKQHT
jgi:hypothetical protein